MLGELTVFDAIDGGRGDVEWPAGRRDIAEVLGETSTSADAGRYEVAFTTWSSTS